MKGFTFGKHEDKMGQRACPASELIFEDCFIPDEYVLLDSRNMRKSPLRDTGELVNQIIHYVVEASRPAVGAFGTGVARGAYEHALKFAGETAVDGKLLINHEWAQIMLAEMYKNVITGRLAYCEANYSNSLEGGIFNFLQIKPLYYYLKYIPQFVIDTFFVPFYKLKLIRLVLPSDLRRRTIPGSTKALFRMVIHRQVPGHRYGHEKQPDGPGDDGTGGIAA